MANNDERKTNKLLSIFSLARKKNKNGNETLVPGKEKDKSTNKDKKKKAFTNLDPIKFPTGVEQAYQYFLQNYYLYNANLNRFQLYRDLLFAVRNNGIMFRALKLYVDETISGKDLNTRIIEIKAKDKKIEKHFYDWLDSIGLTNKMLYQISYDINLYGDAFWTHGLDYDKGITSISMIDPFMIKDKIMFNINSIAKVKSWINQNLNYCNKYESLKNIIDIIGSPEKMEDLSLYFQTYLLGYEIKYDVEDQDNYHSVPPWFIGTAGQGTTSSEFFPFSIPLFLYSLAPYKSFKTTEMLVDMLRVASFPKEIINIKGGETLTTIDRELRVDEVRQFIENISPVTNTQDNLSVGNRLYAMEDLFTWTIEDSKVDLDSLGDLEMKRDDLILTTGIPDTYLIPSKGSGGLGGENASALYFNNKIFQRSVEGNKQAILEGIENSYRLHLALTEDFDSEFTEFELSMPVSSSMYTSDQVSQDKDMLNLSLEILNSLSQALGLERGDVIPPDIVKDVILKYMPIDPSTLNKWVNALVKAGEESEEEQVPTNNNRFPFNQGNKQASKDTGPMIVPMDTSTTSKKEKNISEKLQKFIERYQRGDDALIRNLYFEKKKEMGFTNRLLGLKVSVNNTYKLLHEKNLDDDKKSSIFSMIRKEKMLRKKRRIEEEVSKKE